MREDPRRLFGLACVLGGVSITQLWPNVGAVVVAGIALIVLGVYLLWKGPSR